MERLSLLLNRIPSRFPVTLAAVGLIGFAPALTLQADSGNATVTQASGFHGDLLRLGKTGNGNVILGSNLNLYVNSASKPVQFDSIVSGSGTLNNYGVGSVQLCRNNRSPGAVLTTFERAPKVFRMRPVGDTLWR